MQRVPVLSSNGSPLMPTKASRARRWLQDGKAKIYPSALNQFAVQLVNKSSGVSTQDIAVGIDPGKLFTGVAVGSAKFTLWTGHLVLPFKRVRERMETRAMMRRTRRSRRINRKVSYSQRAHRQKRFDNRRGSKLPPSIRSNRQLHLFQFSKGGKRRKYGGTVTAHGFRKGDYVEALKAGVTYRGWVSGDTKNQVSLSNADWKRIAQFSARKVRLLNRSTGLIVKRVGG